MSVGCVIPARDEQPHLVKTIESLHDQIHRVHPIIVVDDGSTDGTGEIAHGMGALVVKNPRHRYSDRTLRVCEAVNAGLRRLPHETDYVMIVGADDVLASDWCSTLVGRMKVDPLLVIASGRVVGSRVNPVLPRGVRIVDFRWWQMHGRPQGQYREIYGWETSLVLWAWWKGCRTAQFADVTSVAQRPVGRSANWADRGTAMRQNGANLPQVAWRALQLVCRDGKMSQASAMFGAYLGTDLAPEPWMEILQGELVRRGVKRRLGFGQDPRTSFTT